RDHEAGAGTVRLSDALRDHREPTPAIVVAERDPLGHAPHVVRGVQVVALQEGHAEGVREHGPDRGLPGARDSHDADALRQRRSSWPPNSNRSAESSLAANSAFPCDSNRSNRAAASTGTGTPASMAVAIVQRPSPESDTGPENRFRSGSRASARAVRSRSQEDTTLPRRQTSAMSGRLRSYCPASRRRLN